MQEIHQLHADLCSALADPRRIMILYALAERPRHVGDLVNELQISQPATSRHLKILRERGLVSARREGANVIYSLVDRRLIEALDLLRAVLRDRISHRATIMEAVPPQTNPTDDEEKL
ncbi:MAG: ArsR family transcriptional regulator [Anaerolineae bacterium]|nr:MAG: ArsR family transcriptional regulator [Anaerolineae bacterium]